MAINFTQNNKGEPMIIKLINKMFNRKPKLVSSTINYKGRPVIRRQYKDRYHYYIHLNYGGYLCCTSLKQAKQFVSILNNYYFDTDAKKSK